MTWTHSLGLLWIALISCVIGANIEGRIAFPEKVPAPGSIDGSLPSFRVVLDGGERSTLSTADGHFIFENVPSGRYTVDVYSPVYMFSQFKVDISSSNDIRVLEFKYPGTPKLAVSHPLVVEAHAQVQYFQPREQFSVMDLARNPSFLALVVPLLMVWLLPKLTESMLDPEEFKQAQEEMGSVGDPQSMLKGLFGGGNANANDDEDIQLMKFPPSFIISLAYQGKMTTRARLERFYSKYNPDKKGEIDTVLERYKGKETSLFDALIRKYGPEPEANEEITFVDAMTLRLQAFYEKYNPDKIGEVPTVLAKYAGKEKQLFEALVKKYGPEPGDENESDEDDSEDEDEEEEDEVEEKPASNPLSRDILYCPIDNLPPEYCEYGPMFEECKPWLAQHVPNLFIQKYNRTIVELIQVEAQIAAGVEGITLEAEGSKSVKKKKSKAHEEDGKTGGKVFVERFQRQKKKFVTVVAGLDDYKGIDIKDIAKRMGKKFACSASVNKLDNGKQQIQLQGDVQQDLPHWLVEEFEIPQENLFYLEKGKSEPVF